MDEDFSPASTSPAPPAVSADDPRLQKCGFAKLVGEGFEYYLRKYEVVLGRNSKSTAMDVGLGDNMNISRQHAKIVYNMENRYFELVVLGKNGVTVENMLYTPESPPQPLRSQDLMTIGDKKFYFLLPKIDLSGPAQKRRRVAPVGPEAERAQSVPAQEPDADAAEEDAEQEQQPNSNHAAPVQYAPPGMQPALHGDDGRGGDGVGAQHHALHVNSHGAADMYGGAGGGAYMASGSGQ